MSKITYAFCNELDKNVSIDEAYYAATEGDNIKTLTFSCVDLRCRAKGVEITAVGYNVHPSKRKVAMHFKRHIKPEKRQHHSECIYLVNDQYESFTGIHQNETPEQALLRHRRHNNNKINDYINFYDPYVSGEKEQKSLDIEIEKFDRAKSGNDHISNSGKLKSVPNLNRTSSFSRFVRYYHQMAMQFSQNELKQFRIIVKGKGETSLASYFKFFPYVFDQPSFSGIQHSMINNKNIRRYNEGFRLFFRGKIYNHIPVSLYISNDQIKHYRGRRELLDILDNSDELGNITAYFIPDQYLLTTFKDGSPCYEMVITDLSKLLFLGDRENNMPISDSKG